MTVPGLLVWLVEELGLDFDNAAAWGRMRVAGDAAARFPAVPRAGT